MKNSKTTLCILIIVANIGAIINFRQYLPTLFKEKGLGGYYYSHQFDSNERWVNTNNKEEIGLSEEFLPDNIEYNFKKNGDSRVIVSTLWGIPSADMNTRYSGITLAKIISDSNKIKKNEEILLKKKIGFSVQELSKNLQGKDNFRILMVKTQPPYPDITLRRIEISILPPDFLIYLPLFLFSIFFPVILYFIFESIFVSSISKRLFIYIFSSLLFYFTFHLCYNFFVSSYIYIMFLSILSYYFVCKLKGVRAEKICLFIFFLILLIGVGLRWNELMRVALAIPHPDATSGNVGYRFLADNMHLFTNKGFFAASASHHEPFYPFLAKIFFSIFGSSDLHLRFVSFFFSVLTILFTYIIANKLFQNNLAALLSAGAISINKFLIEQSVYGLRTEFETVLFLLIFYYCYLRRDSLSAVKWVIITILLGAIWILTRFFMVLTVMFIVSYSSLNKKWDIKKKIILPLLILFLSLLPFLPYKYNVYKTYGSASWNTDFVTTDSANIEFKGKPGFPRAKVTSKEYFFQLHSIKEFVVYHIIGELAVFNCLNQGYFNMIQEQNHFLKMCFKNAKETILNYPFLTLKVIFSILFTCFSVLLALLNKKFRIILYLILISTFHNAFGYGVNIIKGTLIVTYYRQIAHALPFFAFMISYAFIFCWESFRRKRGGILTKGAIFE